MLDLPMSVRVQIVGDCASRQSEAIVFFREVGERDLVWSKALLTTRSQEVVVDTIRDTMGLLFKNRKRMVSVWSVAPGSDDEFIADVWDILCPRPDLVRPPAPWCVIRHEGCRPRMIRRAIALAWAWLEQVQRQRDLAAAGRT